MSMCMSRRMAMLSPLFLFGGCQFAGDTGRLISTTAPAEPGAANDKFSVWITHFRAEAQDRGIKNDVLAAAFARAQYQLKIIKFDRSQPEFTRAVWSYLDNAVSDDRIRSGRSQLARWNPALGPLEQHYGVR